MRLRWSSLGPEHCFDVAVQLGRLAVCAIAFPPGLEVEISGSHRAGLRQGFEADDRHLLAAELLRLALAQERDRAPAEQQRAAIRHPELAQVRGVRNARPIAVAILANWRADG